MNLSPRLVSILILAATATCAAISQPAPPPLAKNLIFEGGFAEHQDGVPVGWSLGAYAGGDSGNTAKVTEDREGNYVTLFVTAPDRAHFVLNLREQITLRPTWKALLCAVDMRVYNYNQGKENYYKPRIHLTFLDAAGKEISSVGVSLSARHSDAWQTAEREVPIPAGASAVKVWLGTFGATGQLEFRNPYIAPVE